MGPYIITAGQTDHVPFFLSEFNSVVVWLDLELGRKEMTDYLLSY